MPKGGHGRSGPPPVEGSRTSERRGLSFTSLPADGYAGDAPAFPLPQALERELEVWAEVWRSPQAAAWAAEPWRWRNVALFVRWSVRLEAEDASAALGQVVMRYADDIGLSAAGLKLNGWKIAAVEAGGLEAVEDAPASVTDIRARFSRGTA